MRFCRHIFIVVTLLLPDLLPFCNHFVIIHLCKSPKNSENGFVNVITVYFPYFLFLSHIRGFRRLDRKHLFITSNSHYLVIFDNIPFLLLKTKTPQF